MVRSRFDHWVKRIRDFSPRIQVITREDPHFRPDRWKKLAEDHCFHGLPSNYSTRLYGWPEDVNQIAFLARFDRSPLVYKQYYELGDHKLFCFGNIAFGLTYFERLGPDDLPVGVDEGASIYEYPRRALTWAYIFHLMKNQIKEVEASSVPKLK